jgi:hypothetical protein
MIAIRLVKVMRSTRELSVDPRYEGGCSIFLRNGANAPFAQRAANPFAWSRPGPGSPGLPSIQVGLISMAFP